MVTCRRALTLLYRETAEVIHVQDGHYDAHGFQEWVLRSARSYATGSGGEDGHEEWIFTVTYPVRVPRIIRLLRYDRYPRRKVSLTRRNVFARDDYSCQYCGDRHATAELTIDHVVPRSRGGKDDWENIVTSCSRCNHKKGMRTVEAAGMKLLRVPSTPRLNPVLEMNLRNQKFHSWRKFVG